MNLQDLNLQGKLYPYGIVFIVIKGEAKTLSNGEEIIIKENESYLVDGLIPHTVGAGRKAVPLRQSNQSISAFISAISANRTVGTYGLMALRLIS